VESRSRLRASRSLSKAFVTTYTTRNPGLRSFRLLGPAQAVVAFTIAAETGILK